MPSKPLPISPAVARLLRERREALGLTLRRVEELSAETGDAIPHSTLARIELGQFDPGVRRLGQLLNLYHVPMQVAGDVLDLESFAGILPMERNPAELRDRALAAWRQGKVAEAIGLFLAFRRRVPTDDKHRIMRQEAILAFAVAAGSLGKLQISRQMLDELLLENPDSRLLIPILIQQSIIWQSLGSSVAAAAFVDSAAGYAREAGPKQKGWVEHQRAHLMIEQRDFPAASKSLARAIQYYRRAKSHHDEARALLTITRLNFEEEKPAAALTSARRAEQFAKRHSFSRIRLSALVDQARALIGTGAADAGKKLLRTVLADSLAADDNLLCFYAHYYLWQAEKAQGNAARAAVELQEARYYAKFVDQRSAEARSLREAVAEASRTDSLAPNARMAPPRRQRASVRRTRRSVRLVKSKHP